ncbi:hypothetical protein H0H93_008795 [Arthromyces matolae]|nr:hypothetical protein H0H93_008795 [Arthromyces matolae]
MVSIKITSNLHGLTKILNIKAAYSSYECERPRKSSRAPLTQLASLDLSHLKALGRPEGFLPQSIVLETLAGMVLGILGASLRAPQLKEITWASEMRKHFITLIAIAFVAAHLHDKGKHNKNTIGAFFNGVFLLALALSIFLQSIERFVNIEYIDSPVQILAVGCVGLALNIISALVVHDHAGHGGHSHGNDAIALAIYNNSDFRDVANVHAQHNHTLDPPAPAPQHNLNLMGVLIHLLGDAINSQPVVFSPHSEDTYTFDPDVAVIFAAILIWKLQSPHRFYADPAVSLAISLIIFGAMKSGRILLEATPLFLNLEKVKEDLLLVPNVLSVHDLHVWHLSQSVILASLHVCVPPKTTLEEWGKTEQDLQHCFSAYGISHVTISPEIHRDSQTTSQINEAPSNIGCRLPSQDEFGCAVNELKKRRTPVERHVFRYAKCKKKDLLLTGKSSIDLERRATASVRDEQLHDICIANVASGILVSPSDFKSKRLSVCYL